jgi:hypothetical protein
MSYGTATLTVRLTPAEKRAVPRGTVHLYNAVTVTLSGFSPSAPGNLLLLVLRGTTLVAQCAAFVASGNDAVGTLDLATAECAAAFADVAHGANRVFNLRVWDTTSQDLRGKGVLTIRGVAWEYDEDTELPSVTVVNPDLTIALETIDGVQYITFKRSDGSVSARIPTV